MHSSGFMFGTGPLGLALLAGSLLGNAKGNSRRRREAQQEAQLAFRHQFDATIYVTDVGFVFHNHEGVFHWDHDSLDAMQMLGPNVVLMQAQSSQGPVTWQLVSPWAELVFAKWALDRHPTHPQLQDGSWFVQEWLAYARAQGRDPWLTTTRLSSQ